MRTALLSLLILNSIFLYGQCNHMTIDSISPKSGAVGSYMDIKGKNLSAQTVYFGTIPAQINSSSSSRITVKIPTGANSQWISIKDASGCIAYAPNRFYTTFKCGGTINGTSIKINTNYLATLSDTRNIISKDMDGDGKNDLVVCTDSEDKSVANATPVSIYRNISSGGVIAFDNAFHVSTINTITGNTRMVQSADFDGDGKFDLVVANYSPANITVFKNTSTPGSLSFSDGVNYSLNLLSGSNPFAVDVADLNFDGKTEIVIVADRISALKNISTVGNIDFKFEQDYRYAVGGSGNFTTGVSLGDLNGDLLPEIITTKKDGDNIMILLNKSVNDSIMYDAVSNTIVLATKVGPINTVIADVDGDGKKDILVAYEISTSDDHVSVFRNTTVGGILSFDARVDVPTLDFPLDIKVADVDGDGKPEICTANHHRYYTVIKNNSTPGNINFDAATGFLATYNTDPTNTIEGLTVADFNDDHMPDFAFIHSKTNELSFATNDIGLTASSSASASTICYGDSTLITVNFTGASPWNVTYTENSFDINTLTGITTNPYSFYAKPYATSVYEMMVSNSTCTGTAVNNAIVYVPTICTAQIVSSTASDMLVNFAGNSPWTLKYTDGAGSHEVTNILSSPQTINITPSNALKLDSITDANCPGVVLGPVTGVGNISNPIQVVISPNPASDFVSINVGQAQVHIQIVDLAGNSVLSTMGSGNLVVNIQDLSSGLYFISVRSGGETLTKKLFVK